MIIRFLHTGDWHLGKKLYNHSRHEDHVFFLDYLLQHIEKEKVDYLLVSGDIFDSPTPPHESQALFYSFLSKLENSNIKKAFFISGNHDSVQYLKIPTPLLDNKKVIISSGFSNNIADHILDEEAFRVVTLPFFKESDLENNKGLNYNSENPLEAIESFFKRTTTKDKTNILLAHHNFGKYSSSGTEHFINLSGVETIPLKLVANFFQYSALGHIHKKQVLQKDPLVVYPGSPIPMRHSESNYKYICQFSILNKGIEKFKEVKLPLKYELKRLYLNEENYKEILDDIKHPSYLEIHIDLTETASALIEKIYEKCENSKNIILNVRTHLKDTLDNSENFNVYDKNITELFEEFYKKQTGNELEKDSTLLKEFKKLIAKTELNETN